MILSSRCSENLSSVFVSLDCWLAASLEARIAAGQSGPGPGNSPSSEPGLLSDGIRMAWAW